VWAARGLLYAWDDRATAAILRATADDAWRVREMAAKVIPRHGVGDALSAVTELRNDHVPGVRSAAERAVAMLRRVVPERPFVSIDEHPGTAAMTAVREMVAERDGT
jgi:HEAT repeat protein